MWIEEPEPYKSWKKFRKRLDKQVKPWYNKYRKKQRGTLLWK
jgi:hypothetical protein